MKPILSLLFPLLAWVSGGVKNVNLTGQDQEPIAVQNSAGMKF